MTCPRAAAAVLLLLLGACGDSNLRSRQVSEQQRIEDLSAEVVRMARLDLPGAACGPAPAAGRNVVVFATADLCLSCLEVGALLRDITRRGVTAPDRAVVTPAAHAREVCDYLRREKVRWRVVGISEEHLPAARAPRGIVYFELEPDGRVRRREHAATPLHLAAIVLPKPGAAAPAHP
ncbi:MAG TPA: hypothetical protein VK358_19575 [Longimicrobium sp.]|nr:hypothetical protein [Longimicrobium sp.]